MLSSLSRCVCFYLVDGIDLSNLHQAFLKRSCRVFDFDFFNSRPQHNLSQFANRVTSSLSGFQLAQFPMLVPKGWLISVKTQPALQVVRGPITRPFFDGLHKAPSPAVIQKRRYLLQQLFLLMTKSRNCRLRWKRRSLLGPIGRVRVMTISLFLSRFWSL